jgi:hypothetical protein
MSDLREAVTGGSQPTEPGWYFDPEGRYSHQAYWDGEKWTGEIRRGRKEARKARERSFRRSWLTVVVVLGFVGLFNWWWDSPTETAADRRAGLSTEHLLAENGISFTRPEGWTEMLREQPNPPLWRYVISPDHGSNWIMLTYITDSGLDLNSSAVDIDRIADDYEAQSLDIIEGPQKVEHAGFSGYELTVDGIVGQETGKHLTGKTVLLHDGPVTYRFDAQWDAAHGADVRGALNEILTSLSVS